MKHRVSPTRRDDSYGIPHRPPNQFDRKINQVYRERSPKGRQANTGNVSVSTRFEKLDRTVFILILEQSCSNVSDTNAKIFKQSMKESSGKIFNFL